MAGTRDLAVSWTAPDEGGSPITDYDLRYYAGTTDPSDPDDWIEGWEAGGADHIGAARSATITGLDEISDYVVQVRANNGDGSGEWSDSGADTTDEGPASPATPTAPATPPAPSVSAVTGTRNLTVSWTAPNDGGSPITDYDLRYYAGSRDPADEADWVGEDASSGLSRTKNTSTTRTITGLRESQDYRVQVRAGNDRGEGGWSVSGSATTEAGTATNNSPRRVVLGSENGMLKCIDWTQADPLVFQTVSAPAGVRVKAGPLADDEECGAGPHRTAPMFVDPDSGDTLAFTATPDVPGNVFLAGSYPLVNPAATFARSLTGLVYFKGVAAFETTDVTVLMGATDSHGATATPAPVVFQVGTFSGSQAPSLAAVDGRQFARNAPIEPFVLPAATGGDVTVTGISSTLPYFYQAAGLPPGLVFDAATRTVSGTPSAAGVFTVTYTADDFDSAYAGKASATSADTADTATGTFTLEIGDRPKISRVRIVSSPTLDSDGDGTNDTYVRGDRILIDVEFDGQPIAVGGEKKVRLRLDVGPDDGDPSNSRQVLPFDVDNLRRADEVLRFVHTVGVGSRCGEAARTGDCDPDGVWVQTAPTGQVLFLEGSTTLTHADTGVAADLTFAGLPATGDPLHKVDGGKTGADVGPRPTSAVVDGDTLTVTFSRNLATPGKVERDELVYGLEVQGAGGIQQHPKKVSVSGTEVTLTLSTPARSAETVTLSYTGDVLHDTTPSRRKVPRFRDLAVTNDMAPPAGPSPLRATVSGTVLRVIFDGPLDETSAPSGSAFQVTATDGDDDRRRIHGRGASAVNGDTVTVTLAGAVPADENASLAYSKPDTSPLKGAGAGKPDVRDFQIFLVVSLSDVDPPQPRGGALTQIGTTPPRSKAVLYFDETLDASSSPPGSAFAVNVSGSSVTVSDVALEAMNVVLTLNRLAPAGTSFDVVYTPGTPAIRDVAGNAAESFRATLIATAAGKPALASAKVNGQRLELTFDKALDPANVPAPGAFAFHYPLHMGERVVYSGNNIATIEVEGQKAVLGLSFPVYPCEGNVPFTVSYTVPTGTGTTPLRGLDGDSSNQADAFDHQDVTNTRSGWCKVGWFDGSRTGSVIVRSKVPFATDVEPKPAWFTVTASGGAVSVTGASYSTDDAHELKLTVDREFAPGETVTVSYRRPERESGLWDVRGKQLDDIVDRPVANNAPVAVPASLESASTEEAGRGLLLTFTKDILVAGVHTDYTVRVDGERRDTKTAFWEDDTVGLLLAERVRWGEAVTVAYAKPASGVVLRDADDLAVESFGPEPVTNTVPPNQPATGAPSIRGDARVGETLEASTADIDDADGLSGAAFTYQWLSDGNDIAGATGKNHTLADAQEGRRVKVRVAFTDDAGNDETLTSAATDEVAPRLNQPATGAPTITGTAQAGETLTASTADIDDADGLSGATFAYQWLADDADIAGATDASLGLDDAQVGSTVKVRVTFTDDAGNAETLTSSATEEVTARPLTAEFRDVPAEHEGKGSEFSFELLFSDDFPGRLDYRVLKDEALQATNARVTGAKRAAQGQNQRWTITVRPRSAEDVTVSLPAGSVRTDAGRELSNTTSATVTGPVGISVADARVEEGAGAVLAFAVTLSRAATSALSVDYATSDGSARAGEDYTAASGTLSFQAGESSATIEVAVLDDAHDEGEETLTLRLSNASGAVVTDDEATGTIENTDLMPAALLARFGRATAEQVVTHIEERMAAPRQRGFRARFAGREFQPGSERDFALGFLSSFAQPMGMGPAGAVPMGGVAMSGAAPMGVGSHTAGPGARGAMGMTGMGGASGMGMSGMSGMPGAPGMAGQRPMGHGPVGNTHEPGLFSTMVGHDPLSNSEFELNRKARGGTLSLWSRNSRSHFSGTEDTLSLNGDVRTSMLGADYARGSLTLGLSIGRTLGLGGYSGPSSGQMTTSMTGFYPWVGYQVNDKVSVWGVTGYGTGMLSLTPGSAAALETGVSMAMSAVGTRGELVGSRATGGFALAFKSDALWVGAASELLDGPAGRLNASEAGVTRVRTALEGSRGFTLGGRVSLRPSVEVGLRRDGGDAETGAGMDLGGGLAFTDTATGLSLDVRVRTLVVHQADGFSDRGMSLSFGWDPTPSSPLGLSARVAPTWGGSAQGGAEALWGNQMAYGAGSHQMHGGGERVDAEVGYGLPVGARLVGTPRVGISTSAYGRDYRVGYILGVLEQGKVSFELGVDAQRRESPAEGEACNGFAGRATIGW